MLHFWPELSSATLATLADGLVREGRLSAEEAPRAIERCLRRLHTHFGVRSPALAAAAG
jgi:polyhydroxyalkanoate synthesis regulator phasin